MKNQYLCDIGDYGKYGLLRFLAKKGIRIGVNWYLTEDDGSNDGGHIKYLQKDEFRKYDPELYDVLKELVETNNRMVLQIEAKGLIINALYYDAPLFSSRNVPSSQVFDRNLWFNNSALFLSDADLIFCDPDNGLFLREPVLSKDSEKYALPEEIVRYYTFGKNVVYYCHKGRRTPEAWETAKIGIKKYIKDAKILVLTYHKGTQRSYIFVIHPGEYKKYVGIITAFRKTHWQEVFSLEEVFDAN